jgi:hypothetical protein
LWAFLFSPIRKKGPTHHLFGCTILHDVPQVV